MSAPVWKSKFGRSTPSTRQPNSLVDSTQVAAQPDTTLGVALACLDASWRPLLLIVALAADEDLNRFWPVLSQWGAWVKSIENQIRDGKFYAMRQLADAAWGLWQSRI